MKINREEVTILHVVIKGNIQVLRDLLARNKYHGEMEKNARRQLKVLKNIKKKLEKTPLPLPKADPSVEKSTMEQIADKAKL